MRTDPVSRRRFPSTKIVGGLSRIAAGVFGLGSPAVGAVEQAAIVPRSSVYTFHQGDVFYPGTGNFVLDPPADGPLFTMWGRAFLNRPNAFVPIQAAPFYSLPHGPVSGPGGIQAGQFTIPESSESY